MHGPYYLETAIDAMLRARTALHTEFARLHRAMLAIVRTDPVCRQLMSVPGVGAVVAITLKSGGDDPARFKRSREVGAHFGLTPKKRQSGETDVTGGITRVGDEMVRTMLYEAANIMLMRTTRFSALKAWAVGVAKRRRLKKVKVALKKARCRPPPHVGQWHHLPLEQGRGCHDGSLSAKEQTRSSGPRRLRAQGPAAGTVKTVKPKVRSWPHTRITLERWARLFR